MCLIADRVLTAFLCVSGCYASTLALNRKIEKAHCAITQRNH